MGQKALKEVKERNQSLCTIMSQGECELNQHEHNKSWLIFISYLCSFRKGRSG